MGMDFEPMRNAEILDDDTAGELYLRLLKDFEHHRAAYQDIVDGALEELHAGMMIDDTICTVNTVVASLTMQKYLLIALCHVKQNRITSLDRERCGIRKEG